MSVETIKALQADHFGRWKNREAIAESMIPVLGRLARERNVVITVFGRSLVNRSVIQILKSHRRVRMIAGDLSVVEVRHPDQAADLLHRLVDSHAAASSCSAPR